MTNNEPVLITGLGPVSSIGIGRDKFFEGLARDLSGIGEITGFDVADRPVTEAGEVQDFYLEDYIESEKTYLDRCSELALAGCVLTLRDAGYEGSGLSVGLSLGTAYGCLDTMRAFLKRVMAKGARLANPLLFSHSYANTPGSLAAIEFSLSGFNATCCTGLSSGGTAIAWAFDALRLGRAEAILAGGMEALSETLYEGCLTQDESPVLGEGAGIVMLETASSAGRRHTANPAQLRGCGTAEGLEAAIYGALDDAAVAAEDVDLLIPAANGTPRLDGAEEAALRTIFGAQEIARIPLKERVGETFGAAAGLAVAAAVWALEAKDYNAALVNTADPAGGCVSLLIAGYEG